MRLGTVYLVVPKIGKGGIENISASKVSEFNKELDSQVVGNRVVSVAGMIACGVNPAGSREILAEEPMFDESEDSWQRCKVHFMRNILAKVPDGPESANKT
jgi:transposase-like protein